MSNLNQHSIIADLLEDNVRYASVLYDYGIDFDKYITRTLEGICQEKKLNVHSIIRQLESIHQPAGIPEELFNYSLDLVVAYLQHTHKVFMRSRLPYMAELIERVDEQLFCDRALAADLKLIFPVFMEDFIEHIYEEEDSLFQYVNELHRFKESKGANSPQLYALSRKYSISEFALEHLLEDEMEGIRLLTNHYATDPDASLHEKVILAELKSFDEELTVHARIENQILLSKAMTVEHEVRCHLKSKSIHN